MEHVVPNPLPLRYMSALRLDELPPSKRVVLLRDAQNAIACEAFVFVDVDWFHQVQPHPVAVLAAGLSVSALRRAGIDTALKFKSVCGFDASHLATEGELAQALVRAFGAAAVVEAFVQDARDAMAVSSSDSAVLVLGLSTGLLLGMCANAPVQASAILRYRPVDASVTYDILKRTTLSADSLQAIGVTFIQLSQQCKLTSGQISALGFQMKF